MNIKLIMTKIVLRPDTETYKELLSNGKKYIVPKFQRNYSWTEDQLQDMWDDMKGLMSHPNEIHYMGYLVFQLTEDDDIKIVIDGQQRLTTFTLLVLAAMKHLESMPNEKERIDELRSNYIGRKDEVNLRMENKLELNRNNDYYYKELTEAREIPKRNVKKTVSLMRKAMDFFYNCFAKDKALQTSIEIAQFLKHVSRKLTFTTMYIADDLNAYKIFETLNARGVKLSSSDLLKNYIFFRYS